ncbi:MAG: hypothetical protein NT062_04845 [Proteobacteria bacterium]|nr:hypothetical protein [Pseudomonadota bacterium]
MSKLSFALAALIAVPLVSSPASADTKALTAAQKSLGGNANVIIGVNVGSIVSSKLFQTMWPAMLAKGGADMKEGLDLADKQCGLDPLKAISDVVVAMDKDSKKGVVYIGLNDKLDQAKLEACTVKIGTAKKKPIPTFKKTGNLVEMTPGEKGREGDKKYYAWVSADVIAVSTEGDKDALAKWTGGKGLDKKAGLGALMAKTATTGAMWGAANVSNTVAPGVDVKGGYGSVGMSGGNLSVDVHAVMADAKVATDTATKATAQLAAVTGAKGAGIPPGIQKALKAVTISGVGSEVVVKAGLSEADMQMLLGLLMMKM